jgi:hypothetical protein
MTPSRVGALADSRRMSSAGGAGTRNTELHVQTCVYNSNVASVCCCVGLVCRHSYQLKALSLKHSCATYVLYSSTFIWRQVNIMVLRKASHTAAYGCYAADAEGCAQCLCWL